jgi:signal transduction histidine kinase
MRIRLRSRLFFSHLIVMLVGLISFLVISQAASHHIFSGHLDQLEGLGFAVQEIRALLLDGFEVAWSKSTLWAVVVGTLASASLSYWVAQRIVRPLAHLERMARQFAAGQLHERVPSSEIPELAQLSASFNRLATSLEDVESRRREVIGDLTHELRTPLTIMRGYLEEAVNRQVAPSLETCELLVRETKRLERLVNDLQELSKAESGHLTLNLQPLNLVPLLNSLVQRFSSQLLEEVSMQVACPAHLPLVLADRDRTEQILVNLIGNAVRHTQQGQIVLRARSDADRVWITVQDTGSGIASEELPHVFERFWRSKSTRTTYQKGTGIGLAITKRLVELQGGEIEVRSQVGQGTTFWFSLPTV